MDEFRTYTHTQRIELLRKCNEYRRRIHSRFKDFEQEMTTSKHDTRYSIVDPRTDIFEYDYSLIFNDLLEWLREQWIWLPFPWDEEFTREVTFEDRWLDDDDNWQTNIIKASGDYSNFTNISYFFAEFLENPCYSYSHRLGNEYPHADFNTSIGVTQSFLDKLHRWIKSNRKVREIDIIRRFYTRSSLPNKKLLEEYSRFEKLVSKHANVLMNLHQTERDYLLGNSILLKRHLELLLQRFIQKLYLENFKNLSYNPQDQNYYIRHLRNTDPFSTSTIKAVFDFNLITEYFKIDILEKGEIFVSENQKITELYDWLYKEEDTLNRMKILVKNCFNQFWKKHY